MNTCIALVLLTFPAPKIREFEHESPVIVDLETRTKAGHPMRNDRDWANWAHELQHQLNSDGRCKHNMPCFYDGGKWLACPEAPFHLRDIKIPKEDQGPNYQLYFVKQRRWWDGHPTYILDEAFAFMRGFEEVVRSGEKDDWRYQSAKEFVKYAEYLNEQHPACGLVVAHLKLRVLLLETKYEYKD